MERISCTNNVNYLQEVHQKEGPLRKISGYISPNIIGNVIKIIPMALAIIASCAIPLVEADSKRDCMINCLGPHPTVGLHITLCAILCYGFGWK